MKNLIISILVLFAVTANSQSINQNLKTAKLNAGIITEKLEATKDFYTNNLGFGVTFENDFYLLLHTPNHHAELSFLLPNHPSQQAMFQTPFNGKGVYLTIEVEDVDAYYKELQEKGIPIALELRDEPWGDRHFSIIDPNGIGVDIVTYAAPEQK